MDVDHRARCAETDAASHCEQSIGQTRRRSQSRARVEDCRRSTGSSSTMTICAVKMIGARSYLRALTRCRRKSAHRNVYERDNADHDRAHDMSRLVIVIGARSSFDAASSRARVDCGRSSSRPLTTADANPMIKRVDSGGRCVTSTLHTTTTTTTKIVGSRPSHCGLIKSSD